MKFKNYIETESGIKDTSTSPGTAGQLLSSTVAGTSWIDQNTISSGTSETIDIQVKNISSPNGGINLSKGDPVYIYGSVGASARLYVDLADADSTATNNLGDSKMPCVALLDQDLAPNIEGTATVVGKLRNLITSPIDTLPSSENDTIYVKSGGGLTLTKPTGSTNLIQNVGQVGRVSTSSSGNIVVAALLRTNDVPNLPEGRIWIGDGNTIVSDTVYVDEPNNRVGIGTANPSTDLDVSSTGANGIVISKTSNQAQVSGRLFFTNDTPTEGFALFNSSGTLQINSAAIPNDTSGNNKISIIGSSGNVGIGETNPGSKLEVAGEIDSVGGGGYKVEGVPWARGNSGLLELGDWDGEGYDTSIFGANGNLAIRTSGGNVGIGTNNPGTDRLAVAGSTVIGGNVEVSDGLGGDVVLSLTPNTGSFQIGDINGVGDEAYIEGDSSSIKIFTGGAGLVETLVCDINQRVGIGIPNPSQTLEVKGSVQIKNGSNAYLYLYNTASFLYSDSGGNTIIRSANNFRIQTKTGGGESVRVNSSGNVGINTTDPKTKLHVASANGNDVPTAGTATGGLFVSNTNKSYGINMGVAGAGWSFIQSQRADGNTTLYNLNLQPLGGNVGIGIPIPGEKLDVAGNIKVSGEQYFNGTIIYGDGKEIIKYSDTWLRINQAQSFTNGIYCGSGILRTDGTFQVGPSGSKFIVNPTTGNVGIGVTNPGTRLEVGGGPSLARVRPAINNQGYIGDSVRRWQAIYATNGTIQTSDIREKTRIKPTKLGLDFINDLNPVSYKWTEGERLDASKDERNHQGLIAQEVAETLEKHGIDKNKFGGLDIQETDEYDDFHAMSYEQLIAPMIKSIQELKAEIEELKKQINK